MVHSIALPERARPDQRGPMLDFSDRISLLSFFGTVLCEQPSTVTDPRLIDEIGARLSKVLAASPASDVEKNVRALLIAFFERFDLVTRDDFEVQKRVLERAQARIADLEQRLAKFEAQSADTEPQAS